MGKTTAGRHSTSIGRKAKAKATAGPSTRPGTPGLAQDDIPFLLLRLTTRGAASPGYSNLEIALKAAAAVNGQ
jgi:hypothetical protein